MSPILFIKPMGLNEVLWNAVVRSQNADEVHCLLEEAADSNFMAVYEFEAIVSDFLRYV